LIHFRLFTVYNKEQIYTCARGIFAMANHAVEGIRRFRTRLMRAITVGIAAD